MFEQISYILYNKRLKNHVQESYYISNGDGNPNPTKFLDLFLLFFLFRQVHIEHEYSEPEALHYFVDSSHDLHCFCHSQCK